MIEYELVRYMKADSTLDTLLGVTGSDSKIYPVQAPDEVEVPYILYRWGIGDPTDEILGEDRIQLTIVSDDIQVCTNIRARLEAMLNLQDDIQDTTLNTGSTDYYIYWSKFSGGDAIMNDERTRYNIVAFVTVKYLKKV